MELLVIVLFFVFFIYFQSRLNSLERQIKEIKTAGSLSELKKEVQKAEIVGQSQGEKVVSPGGENVFQGEEMQEWQAVQGESPVLPSVQEKNFLERFFSWLSEEWPLKVGVFLLILSVGWFVTYAFINNWIGEVGRIGLGILFGVIVLLFGFQRGFKNIIQGNALMVLGSASILVSILSGIGMYDLFPATLALFVAFSLSILMSFTAVKQDNVFLGITSLLSGLIVPLFVIDRVDILLIFFYLFILTLGMLWVGARTGWNALNIISLVSVFFYSIFYEILEGFDNQTMALIFSIAFIAVFYVSNIFTVLAKKSANIYDLTVSGLTGLIFLIWMLIVGPEEAQVYLITFGGLIFALGAYFIFSMTKLKDPVVLYSVVATVLLVSATAVQFKNWELLVALTVEFTLIAVAGLYLNKKNGVELKGVEKMGIILYAVLFFLSLENLDNIFNYLNRSKRYHSYYDNYDISGDMLVTFLLCVFSFLVAYLAIRILGEEYRENKEKLNLVRFYGLMGGFYATALVWIMAHLLIYSETVATTIALIIYTLVGIFFYVAGKMSEYRFYKIVGEIFFAIVLFRLFFYEFGNMGIEGKIITFFIVGALFVSTTFFGRKKGVEEFKLN